MNSFNTASLINLLGFTVGVALYALLLMMVVRHRKGRNEFSFDFLLLATAILGLLWNAGELFVFVWNDFGFGRVSPILVAVSYSALGFLPSVVVHSAWKNSEIENVKIRFLTVAAYGLSILASVFHFRSAVFFNAAPSDTALQILTFGSLALLAGLLALNFGQTLEKKTIWITALLIFTVSAFHLTSKSEEKYWLVELVAHQSSLPLAFAILLQDYRFAFADLFLKRAISLLLLASVAFGLYLFVAVPLLAWHETHDRNDVQAAVTVLTLWMATALIYPQLHKFAVWLVDKIILRRDDYQKLQIEISNVVEKQETIDNVLNITCQKLAFALTANESSWSETAQNKAESSLPSIDFTSSRAEIFVPTVESPFYNVHLENFSGGRRLLSDEIEMLGAVALITARQIDALRVTGERYSREIREREFSRLAAEAELRALRAQINPHFLFNALTAIGYLIQTAPEKAFETLMKLTQLLRRVLKTSSEFSTLGEEIELVKSYLEIEQARFEERLEIEINVAKDLEKLSVPSFVLQPLVENAVKHGISKAKSGGKITISACLENEKANNFLKLSVSDTGAGDKTNENLQNRQKGVGLNNIEQRLQNYYGDSASLTVENQNGKGMAAEIKIPVSHVSKIKPDKIQKT
jgi:two-component sensor histidine kinase/sirohydrochlorin ferrochelatase